MKQPTNYVINGDIQHTITPLDRGFAYGDGVFRTLKVVNGLPQHWPLHYQKLVADCAAIGIVCPNPDLLMADFQQLFNADDMAVAKIMITRGEGVRGYAQPAITVPTRVWIKSSLPQYPEYYFSDGVHLFLCQTRLAYQPKLAGIKHLNRLENILARSEWDSMEAVEGLLLDADDRVIECTASNLFARYGQTLKTPNLTRCGVAGVTRERIMQLAHLLQLTIQIEDINLEQLLLADEILICNSLMSVVQVTQLHGRQWQVLPTSNALRQMLG